jgi:hypothetical protein
MRSPGGARLNGCVFALVNVWLVIGWAWQLMQEFKEAKEENIRVLKEEIKFWDTEIERLEGLLEVCEPVEKVEFWDGADDDTGEAD